jgi:hypothetical protein
MTLISERRQAVMGRVTLIIGAGMLLFMALMEISWEAMSLEKSLRLMRLL